MYVKTEVEGFSWLEYNCWGGAVDTLNTIREKEKEDEFMDYLEEMFFESSYEIPTLTELNDFLWFDDQTIFEDLGINEDNDEEDYEDLDEEEYKITDIEWDLDDLDDEEKEEEKKDLPKMIYIDKKDVDYDLDNIAEYLSDNYGFCVKSFNIDEDYI